MYQILTVSSLLLSQAITASYDRYGVYPLKLLQHYLSRSSARMGITNLRNQG